MAHEAALGGTMYAQGTQPWCTKGALSPTLPSHFSAKAFQDGPFKTYLDLLVARPGPSAADSPGQDVCQGHDQGPAGRNVTEMWRAQQVQQGGHLRERSATAGSCRTGLDRAQARCHLQQEG